MSHHEGVDLMPANIELSGMEVSLVNAMSRETILKQYDFILLDCILCRHSIFQQKVWNSFCRPHKRYAGKLPQA